jgi:hypothetical protein
MPADSLGVFKMFSDHPAGAHLTAWVEPFAQSEID